MKGKIYVLRVASGDLRFLNEHAARVLRSAEVVLHDDLVSPELLDLIPASAQVLNVQKLSTQAPVRLEKIHSLVISAAGQGHQVVRLKASGAISAGRTDEEIEALARAGVEYESILEANSSVGAAAAAASR
jgi:siroheme synthase